jgi:hypothetical protein
MSFDELNAEPRIVVAIPSSDIPLPTTEARPTKMEEQSDSELTDLDDQKKEDDGDNWIEEPAYYDGTVPVFQPTMARFKDFQKYVRSSV